MSRISPRLSTIRALSGASSGDIHRLTNPGRGRECIEHGNGIVGLTVVLEVRPPAKRRLDEVVDLVRKAARDAAVDLRPEVSIRAAGCDVVREIEALFGNIECRRRLGPDDLERRAEAVHQPVGPGPGIIEAADRAVLEIYDGIEGVLVAGSQRLTFLRIDAADARAANPLHRVDIVHAHVKEDGG